MSVKPKPDRRLDPLKQVLADASKLPAVEARFWPKVDRSGGADACWPWMAGRKSDDPREAYGKFKVAAYKQVSAHRVAYALHNRKSPGALCVLHSCDNSACVNPGHLFLGTLQDNTDDMLAKGRHISPDISGERCHFAKLSEADVGRVFEMIRAGDSVIEIAAAVGVTPAAIYAIRQGKSWARHPARNAAI